VLNNTQTGFHDFFLAKYDASGNSAWAKTATGDYDDIGYSVMPSGNNIYVTGYYASTSVQFGTNPAMSNPGAPSPDMFIAQYSSSGTANWSSRAGGTDEEQGRCVYADAAGNAYVSGFFISASIGFGSGTLNNAFAGTKDLYVAAFNSSGTSLWSMSVGNTNDEIGYGIACTPAADMIYCAGMFNSGFTTFGSNTIFKGCGDDVFLAKLGTATAIMDHNHANDIVIAPNPSNGIFNLYGDLHNAEIEIYDALGERVFAGKGAQSGIDLSGNPKGIYFVRINNEGKVCTKRLVIE
jgi:hypothetical protein